MSTRPPLLQAERLSYPGLLPREVLILQAWLKLHESEYDRFDYNVRVGQGTDPGPTYEPGIRKMAIDNTKKRIDAVAYKGNQATLIEVKDRAQLSAVGQLVGYSHLYPMDHTDEPVPLLLLVTNRVIADLPLICGRSNIMLHVVEADFGILKRK